jgi:squalene-hopene/tetraprenyl-beta-curcumene cyclase
MAQYAQAEGATGELSLTRDRLLSALRLARRELLSRRLPAGYWEGHLSSSALSTATAVTALGLGADPEDGRLVTAGVHWLAEHQNSDGGWGDTTDSPSNLATTLLCFSALTIANHVPGAYDAVMRATPYVNSNAGTTPAERVAAITSAYGEDRTFAVPILMNCAVADLVEWQDIPSLPYELATLPQSWYRLTKMQVVSYALPALIAVGLAIEYHRPLMHRRSSLVRRLVSKAVQRKLVSLQPLTGGFLEATPLTAFVCMALLSLRKSHSANPRHDPTATVLNKGLDFLRRSMRPDGSWPIDTNLSVWVTSSALNALELSGGLPEPDAEATRDWLTERQCQTRHPYTGAAPGGFGWTHLAGGVPDADDTSGALLALADCGSDETITNAALWLCDLQNTDGGWPTFCRGWGKLPFDKSCDDITAHALRAVRKAQAASDCRARARTAPAARLKDRDEDTVIAHPARYKPAPYRRAEQTTGCERARRRLARAINRGLDHLSARQRPDGSWVPLWFGNQAAPEHLNPVLGTSRVLLAWAEFDHNAEEALQGLQFLVTAQNDDGGWGGAPGVASTVEESALAICALSCWPQECRIALERGLNYLLARIENDDWTTPAPIGLYFASLWYSEELYPIVWTVEALGRGLDAISLA